MVINKDRINIIIENSSSLDFNDLNLLDQTCQSYPWFQAARSIYLKLLKDESSPQYNKEIQVTATHTADRSVLFDYITSIEFTQNRISNQIKKQQEYLDAIPVVSEALNPKKEIELNNSMDHSHTLSKDLFLRADDLELVEPLDFKKEDSYSFIEWLKLTKIQPVSRSNKQPHRSTDEHSVNAMEIIDQFLAEKPKIKLVKKTGDNKNLADLQNPKPQLMTETLAQVYVAQKNYEKAIQAYEILKLHHPEKSGFFADQIREIKKFQSNT